MQLEYDFKFWPHQRALFDAVIKEPKRRFCFSICGIRGGKTFAGARIQFYQIVKGG